MAENDILVLRDLHAHYGKSHILQGVNFDLRQGEVVSLLGRNGSGRSTTMKAVMGLVTPSEGDVLLNGRNLAGQRPFSICRAGIGYVPEEREAFLNLTANENLAMGAQKGVSGATQWTVDQMFDYFPRLKARANIRARSLSGGEQQMLTMCRSLLGNPLVMLIDEPTEGLAPMIVQAVGEMITDINRKGVSVLLVEQKLVIALKVSHRVAVMGHGRIVFEGTPDELTANQTIMNEWLAV